MNVNEKGVSGLIRVIGDLQARGFYTFIPFDDHSPVDLIAMNESGRIFRLQIKFRSLKTIKGRVTKKYSLPLYSVINGKMVDTNKDLIDGWAIYLKDDNKVVYVSKSEIGNNKTTKYIYPNIEYAKMEDWQS